MASGEKTSFTIGTRKSKLALLQTDIVQNALQTAWPGCEFDIHSRHAAGDLNKVTPLREFTTKNLWTEELEELLIQKKLDLVVHSLKDVPTQIPSSCALAAIITREDPRDVLVVKKGLSFKTLAELPAGSVVGTSSVRRIAQIGRHYPHLKVQDVRGNIDTRLAKLDDEDGPFTCLILAAAGLLRSGWEARITQYLDSKNGKMLHAVGQGALGIEIRSDDERMKEMIEKIGDKKSTFACLAERNLLRVLEGGCSAPLGVETEWIQNEHGEELLRLRSIVTSVDGQEAVEVEKDCKIMSNEEAEAFGKDVAMYLVENGAGKILEDIQQKKKCQTTKSLRQAFDKRILDTVKERGLPSPLFITIFLGANDACFLGGDDRTYVPIAQYEEHIRHYVDTILEHPATKDTRVILISPPPVDVPPPPSTDFDLESVVEATRAPAAMGRGHRTWESKRKFAKKINEIGHEFEAKTDRFALFDFWTLITKVKCQDETDSDVDEIFHKLDLEDTLPGSGMPGAPRFGLEYFIDGLHFGEKGYDVLGRELLKLLLSKWPELNKENFPLRVQE
ncbi:porphobilinogen deaminase [Ophidiomyces ophidiicola]|nr:porphobilinogen deaminase [Ophidiomyces ophidiicola]